MPVIKRPKRIVPKPIKITDTVDRATVEKAREQMLAAFDEARNAVDIASYVRQEGRKRIDALAQELAGQDFATVEKNISEAIDAVVVEVKASADTMTTTDTKTGGTQNTGGTGV